MQQTGLRSRTSMLGILALVVTLLTGCYHNSIPMSDRFGTPRPVTQATVFVDANGRFYPDDWEAYVSRATMARRHAFDRLPSIPYLRPKLEQEEQRQLAELEALMNNAGRLIVVIHGFNDTEAEATFSYDRIVERTAAGADQARPDLVIRFYWDGEAATAIGGQIPIWFKAVVHSQMAGMMALRKILNRAHDKDVYLISHSRGASVILSALSDPPFDKGALRKIPPSLYPALVKQPVLAANRNRIRAIMLAPAIGAEDFEQPACADIENCRKYRDFSPQLRSIRYTTNGGDWVLKKGLRKLSSRLHATDLGYDVTVGKELQRIKYHCLYGTAIKAEHGHTFGLYVVDPEFGEMFDAALRDTIPCPDVPPSS